MSVWRELLLTWLLVASSFIFLSGFFPVKSDVGGQADANDIPEWPDGLRPTSTSWSSLRHLWSRRVVGQLVIVLIDALRADFIIPEERLSYAVNHPELSHEREAKPKIEYLLRLLDKTNESTCVIARATPPTVTLPRIKALTTGSIPGFVDVVLNFGSSEMKDDSLIEQWKAADRKMVMFGDDTWIKLFPRHFARSDGTTSFFVSDYTEVDLNVTRHVDSEMRNDDWDVAILHYLGLDHIGHLSGPLSSLMPNKLDEMGNVIEKINEVLREKPMVKGLPPLILILGDHGMSDAGSHGGASLSETLTPIMAVHPKGRRSNRLKSNDGRISVVNQQDLVSTLAALTGVPIPKNNIGALIPDLLRVKEDFEVQETLFQLAHYLYNADQVAKVVEKNIPAYQADSGYQQFQLGKRVMTSEDPDFKEAIKLLKSSLVGMSERLSENLLEYNLMYMATGIISALSVLIFSTYNNLSVFGSSRPLGRWILTFELMRIFSLASTSFIEEQHQTAYFLSSTAVVLSFYYEAKDNASIGSRSVASLAALMLIRVARKWNQTGDKWSHLPDVSDYLLRPERIHILTLLQGSSLMLLAATMLHRLWSHALIWRILLILSYAAAFMHHSAKESVAHLIDLSHSRGLYEAKLVYLVSIVLIVFKFRSNSFVSFVEAAFEAALPIFSLLSTPQNTIILVAVIAFDKLMVKILPTASDVPTAWSNVSVYTMLGSCVYFFQGNSNSLASIDVGAGYTGITSYNPVIVGCIIVVNTFSGPILSTIMFLKRHPVDLEVLLEVTNLFCALETFVFMAIVTSQRYHLFVWTVFSPKLLYMTAFTLAKAVLVSILAVIHYASKEIKKS